MICFLKSPAEKKKGCIEGRNEIMKEMSYAEILYCI